MNFQEILNLVLNFFNVGFSTYTPWVHNFWIGFPFLYLDQMHIGLHESKTIDNERISQCIL